jgi:hypothetical protein
MVRLLRRNAAFVYFSFVVTGLTSIAPQRLFAGASPESARAWVAGTLLVGTVASIAGVWLAQRYGLSKRPAPAATVLILTMTGALLWSFGTTTLLGAAMLQIAARFLANYTKQDLDHRAVTIAGSEARVANDRMAVLMRFIGMLIGPLWFGAFQLTSPAMLTAIVVMMALSLLSVGDLAQTTLPEPDRTQPRKRLLYREWVLIAVSIGIYATYYLLASNIVYMLGRVYAQDRANVLSGILITVVYATAMLTTVVSLRGKRDHLGLWWMAPAPLIMAGVGPALNSGLASSLLVDVAGAVALGLGFAFYLLAVRNQVTMRSRAQDSRWLGFFNNLANTSALLAFSVMAVLVAVSRVHGVSYETALAIGLSTLSVGTLAGAALCKRLEKSAAS